MRRSLVLAGVIATLIAACTDTSGLANGGDQPSDAGSSDASSGGADGSTKSPADSGSETSTGGGPNLLTNADFELGCAAWEVGFGFISEATEAHGGTKSCKFCMDTNWEAFLEQDVDMAVEPGKTYFAEAWFKPASSLTSLETAGYVENNLRATSPGAENKFTDGPTLTGDWLHVTSLYKPTLAYPKIYVQFRLQQTGNPADQGNIICVYVDDFVLRRLD